MDTNLEPNNNNLITPPLDYNYSALPYYQLDWEKFEKLCYNLLCEEYGAERCHMYGLRGQSQHGFDCYVRLDDKSYMLFQVKKVDSFKKKDLVDALGIWEDGEWYSKTSSFTLFSSNNLQDTNFLDQFEIEKQRLSAKNITLDAMGCVRIDLKLKNYPGIVQQFFGEPWRDSFCNPLALRNYRGSFLSDTDHQPVNYQPVQFYIPRKLTNPTEKVEVYKGHYQPLRVLLPDFITSQLAKNKLARAIVMADAATGKSKEVENLAAIYSNEKGGLFPVLIRLKNFHGDIETYISAFYPQWKEILPERLILLFDGLDEVPSGEFTTFVKKFNTFIQANHKTNIIATIRSNVFSRDIGAGIEPDNCLTALYLNGLENEDISLYLQERIPVEKQRRQIKKFLDKKWVNHLLTSPFYLSALTDLFLDNLLELPKNKAEIIEKIIHYKIRKDDKKYGSEINPGQLLEFATKLALFLTLSGVNSVSMEKTLLLGEIPLENIKRCSLFRVESDHLTHLVSFEHNNFQEYLAAKSLAKLDWETLEPILFHTTGVRILKPKMFNTVNYLFTILDISDPAFKNLFRLISETGKELFLKFERDKLSLNQRLEIFKSIILKGKSQQIYYLGDDFRLEEFCGFVNYSGEAIKFILNELSSAKEHNHLYCLLDIIYHYEQLKLTLEIKKDIQKQIEKILLTGGFPYPVYDRAIDILTVYQFFNARLLKLIKQVPLNDDKMVRGAIIKYIDEGKFVNEFKYVIESDAILSNSANRIIAGLERLYMRYVLNWLNTDNAVLLLQHFKKESKRLEEVVGHDGYFDEKKKPIDQVYKKLGSIYTQTGDNRIYELFIDFLSAISYEGYKLKQWGDPSLFFENVKDKQKVFLDFVNHKNLDELDYFLFKFYDDSMGKLVVDLYLTGKISEDQVRIIRRSLQNPQHNNLQALLLENFGDRFRFQEQINWDEVNRQRVARDLELLVDHAAFLEEGKNVYKLINLVKKDPEAESVDELEYSERKEIQKKLNNNIILRAISDYKIKGGFANFKKAFDIKGWEWYVFQTVGIYIRSDKKELSTQLLEFAKRYLIEHILPTVVFTTAFRETKNGSYFISDSSSHLMNFFIHSDLLLDEQTLLEILKLDYYGYDRDPLQKVKKERKLYRLVYERTGPNEFKAHILKNLQSTGLAPRVITSQAAACLEYNFTEGLPYILQRITDPKFPEQFKEYLIDIVIGLSDGPEIFEDIFYSISGITKEWQYKICRYLFESGYAINELKTLVSKSAVKTRIKGTEVYWKFGLLKLAIELGSKKAISYLFNTYFIKLRSSSFLNVKPDWFKPACGECAELIITYCFRALEVSAPTFTTDRRIDFPEILEETIRICAGQSQKLFSMAMETYEGIIAKNIEKNPNISYFRWYERRLVTSYLGNSVSYETEEEAIEIVKKLCIGITL